MQVAFWFHLGCSKLEGQFEKQRVEELFIYVFAMTEFMSHSLIASYVLKRKVEMFKI